MKAMRAAIAIALMTGLVACDRSEPPVRKIERAAEDAIGAVEGERLPALPGGPYAPRNECRDLPGASEFLLNLNRAVEARDADALVELAAEDIQLDFGGGAGRDELRARLQSDDYDLWDTLEELVTLGCASDDTSMITIPWYFAQDIEVDPYMGGIVTGVNVPMYAAPADDADVLAEISWDAVEALPVERVNADYEQYRWTNPETGEDVTGFIKADQVRAIIDYRLGATRRNQRWRLVYFIAGD